MIYASELTWSGRTGMEGEYQKATKRMGRATLDVFRSTPLGIVAAESGLAPTRALLDHRQVRPTQRLYARPRGGDGPGGWIARRFHLGTNKEVFDAEIYAIYQALRTTYQRQESGHGYTPLWVPWPPSTG